MDHVQLNTVSTVEAVCKALEDDIFHLRFPPGSKITENDLTSRYGVSRNTIREAIAYLLSNGLLEKIANKGVYVRTITGEDLLELFRLRELLELEAMRQIMHSGVIPADLSRYVEALEAIAASHVQDAAAIDAYVRADIRFHQQLVAAAGSPRLNRLYETIITEVMYCIYLSQSKMASENAKLPTERLDQHRKILEALEAEDPELAAQVISTHMRESCRQYYEEFEQSSKQ